MASEEQKPQTKPLVPNLMELLAPLPEESLARELVRSFEAPSLAEAQARLLAIAEEQLSRAKAVVSAET